MYRILVLNLGATSTKVSIYEDSEAVYHAAYRHNETDIARYPNSKNQLYYRADLIKQGLADAGFSVDQIDAAAARIANIKYASKGGTYLVNQAVRDEVIQTYEPDKPLIHGARLTLPLLDMLFQRRNTPIYFTNPPFINEMTEEAQLSGHPLFRRIPTFHALNTREIGIRLAKQRGKRYDECNFVFAHLGGGVSLSAHQHGVIVDCNNAAGGDGPFSPERSGTLPVEPLVDLCFSGDYTREAVQKMIRGEGGVKAYLGTTDIQEVERRINAGDEMAALVSRALAYQIAKSIGAYVVAIDGEVDAIVITGGFARSGKMVDLILKRVEKLAEVVVWPGELEAEALVAGALRVLTGEEEAIEYPIS